jgi:hypothetical protein
VVHSAPGRLRLRLDAGRRDAARFERVRAGLERCDAVLSAEARPLTGSVLVRHRGDAAALVRFARERGLFSIAPEPRERASATASLAGPAKPVISRPAYEAEVLPAVRQLQGRFRWVDRQLRRWTSGSLNLAEFAVASFAVLGIVQLMRGKILPQAGTLFWYATGVARLLDFDESRSRRA